MSDHPVIQSPHPPYGAAQLLNDLRVDEGYQPKPYRDTMGNISIGIGRNLTGNGLSDEEIMILYQNDIDDVVIQLDHHVSWWRSLPPGPQRVMINLCFNMGWNRFFAFKQFLALMEDKEFEAAADDLKGTAWYGQVGERGPRMIARLTGNPL